MRGRGVVQVGTILSDERDKFEKSHVKQAVTMNGYPDWLINSISTIQPSLGNTTFVSSDDTSDDARETEIETTHKKPSSKKCPVIVPYIHIVSEQIRRRFKQYDVPAFFKPITTPHQLLVRQKDKLLKEQIVGPVYTIFHMNPMMLHIYR